MSPQVQKLVLAFRQFSKECLSIYVSEKLLVNAFQVLFNYIVCLVLGYLPSLTSETRLRNRSAFNCLLTCSFTRKGIKGKLT